MDNQTPSRTLSSFINQASQNDTTPTSRDYHTFLTIFALTVSNRFPDNFTLEQINEQAVRSIAEVSFVCSQIAEDVWNQYQNVGPDRRRQSLGPRSSRTA